MFDPICPLQLSLFSKESPLYRETTANQVSPEGRLYHRQGNRIQLSLSRGGCIAVDCCFYSLQGGDDGFQIGISRWNFEDEMVKKMSWFQTQLFFEKIYRYFEDS